LIFIRLKKYYGLVCNPTELLLEISCKVNESDSNYSNEPNVLVAIFVAEGAFYNLITWKRFPRGPFGIEKKYEKD